jgi:hypothetical protein
MDDQNKSAEMPAGAPVTVPFTDGAIEPGAAISGAPLDGYVVGAVVVAEQPPIDNDHVAPGATPFTDTEIAANASATSPPAAPPSSGDASAPTPTVSATVDAPAQGADAADGGAAPTSDAGAAPVDPLDDSGTGDVNSGPHPSCAMLEELHEFMGMAAHFEAGGNLPSFVTTARQLIADIQATFG